MKYYYQVLLEEGEYCLFLYSKRNMTNYKNKILKLEKDEKNHIEGPGLIVEMNDITWKSGNSRKKELNKLSQIYGTKDVNLLDEILKESLIIENSDVIENLMKYIPWCKHSHLTTELKMITQILVDRYLKHTENEEEK